MSWRLEKKSGNQKARMLWEDRYLEDPESWGGPRDFIRLENKLRTNKLLFPW